MTDMCKQDHRHLQVDWPATSGENTCEFANKSFRISFIVKWLKW